MFSPGRSTRTLASPPADATIQRLAAALLVRASKAIHLPSGDHAGEPAVPPSLLKIGWPSVIAAFQSQISQRPFRKELTRIWLPSGEILGEYSSPGVSKIFWGVRWPPGTGNASTR